MSTAVHPHATAIDEVGDRWLLGASAFFTAAVLFHNADHVRRGADSLTTDVFVAGTAAIVLEVVIVVLCCQRHRVAALVAAVAGIQLAIGYVLVHFLPDRSWLSDSLEVLAASALALAGVAVLLRRGGIGSAVAPYRGQRTVVDAVRHPLALAMALGNVAVLAISFAQLD